MRPIIAELELVNSPMLIQPNIKIEVGISKPLLCEIVLLCLTLAEFSEHGNSLHRQPFVIGDARCSRIGYELFFFLASIDAFAGGFRLRRGYAGQDGEARSPLYVNLVTG